MRRSFYRSGLLHLQMQKNAVRLVSFKQLKTGRQER